MGDLRNALERMGRRVEPTVDGLERLERRRRTKERNRRVAAGALALLVAVGGSIAAYAALREPDRAGIAGGASGPSGAGAAPRVPAWNQPRECDVPAARRAPRRLGDGARGFWHPVHERSRALVR